MRVIGVPKTIDNDLAVTDHCPGYGSVVKYICATVRELACDNEAMGQNDLVSILEVMGRNAGWIAAGSALAKRRDHPLRSAAPDLSARGRRSASRNSWRTSAACSSGRNTA